MTDTLIHYFCCVWSMAEANAFFEKTRKVCLQTQILVEHLKQDLAALRAKAVSANAYNEVASVYLERAKLEAAGNFEVAY